MTRKIIFLLPLFFLLGGNCDKGAPPVLSTQLDHLSSGALVSCDSYVDLPEASPLQLRTCLVLSNPIRPLLRVFDVSEGQFLLSPIGYSPLGVRVDGMTTQLVPFENDNTNLVFNLDANTASVSVLNGRNAARPSFSTAQSLPKIVIPKRPQNIFLHREALGTPQLIAAFADGSIQRAPYDISTSQFGALQPATPVSEAIIDSAYDPNSELLVRVTATQNILVSNIGLNPATSAPIPFDGRVRIAIGQINSTFEALSGAAPHLLIMRQDAPELRIIRLNPADSSIVFDKTITLRESATQAYFPTGENKAVCCGGTRDWLAVGSEKGLINFLTSADLTGADKNGDYNVLDVGAATGARGLVQILGGDVRVLTGDRALKDKTVCPRQMFFLFEAGLVASVCEGVLSGVSAIIMRNALSEN